ncbi:non-canonical purine NTP pyrophosphatase [Paenibacillus chitinolyticus]|uniref:dITP/XTP pyrophosphatase n=1 Tax=Paenibacillus chitinolyticus TaxID=79263 RepID=A0A410X291_9BACL|nr:non-canonical purine NTP pyrophosphatase [Paenibacillus chitinolyticus]MCY9593557.1 non-canonical purine NTP pyrophosphatase [Paenibacillus chitinolyticus]MCY9597528.1 non-canonical purine NTP pyrophosphatase [Paenibacillus chitinolyticus]QAV20725.1 non-canonical purine NTP pyrophosphatase [Paenibacillus chitinolyticus]
MPDRSASGVVVIATRNKGKVREFAHYFARFGKEVRSLDDFDDMPDIVEDGATFAANARIKASAIAGRLNLPVLADDSGLCVDALGGDPGVYSARYAGEHAADAANNAKLLRELGAVSAAAARAPGPPDGPEAADAAAPQVLSTARFVCALALVDPLRGDTLEAEGTCEGVIIAEPRGTDGFGYDPLFYLPERGLTMAELPLEEKNAISHRAAALRQFFERHSGRLT